MKSRYTVTLSFLVMLGGCAAPSRLQESPGAARVGAPSPPAGGDAPTGGTGDAERGAVRLPERLALPASYRLMLLDGHLALVRESDAQALTQAPTSMRIVSGEIARGELAYQPALLPQEIAAEVATNRESSARMDNALDAIMRRSRDLTEQALALQAQARKLAEMLTAEEGKVRDLEAARAPVRPNPTAQAPDPGVPAD